MSRRRGKSKGKVTHEPQKVATSQDTEPDWSRECEVCGQTPIVPATGMCGPCTFGESDTMGGNW